MTRISFSNNGSSPLEKLIGHNRVILEKWVDLENAVFNSSSLSSKLLEQVRRALSFKNECEYCMVKGGKPQISKDEKKIQFATSFAEMFAIDHKSITDKHFEILREEFNETEISELCSFISFITATQRLGRIYQLTEDKQINAVTSMDEFQKLN